MTTPDGRRRWWQPTVFKASMLVITLGVSGMTALGVLTMTVVDPNVDLNHECLITPWCRADPSPTASRTG